MISSIILRNRTVHITKCSASTNSDKPIQVSRKAFEKKRSVSLKKNLNELLLIASQDIKEYGDFFKELDVIHKKALDKWVPTKKVEVKAETINDVSDDENIFIVKDKDDVEL